MKKHFSYRQLALGQWLESTLFCVIAFIGITFFSNIPANATININTLKRTQSTDELRCPFCLEVGIAELDEGWTKCLSCQTPIHASCSEELGRCPVCPEVIFEDTVPPLKDEVHLIASLKNHAKRVAISLKEIQDLEHSSASQTLNEKADFVLRTLDNCADQINQIEGSKRHGKRLRLVSGAALSMIGFASYSSSVVVDHSFSAPIYLYGLGVLGASDVLLTRIGVDWDNATGRPKRFFPFVDRPFQWASKALTRTFLRRWAQKFFQNELKIALHEQGLDVPRIFMLAQLRRRVKNAKFRACQKALENQLKN